MSQSSPPNRNANANANANSTTTSTPLPSRPSIRLTLFLAITAMAFYRLIALYWPFSIALSCGSLAAIISLRYNVSASKFARAPRHTYAHVPNGWYMVVLWTTCLLLGLAADKAARNVGEACWYQMVWVGYLIMGCEGLRRSWRLHLVVLDFAIVVLRFVQRCLKKLAGILRVELSNSIPNPNDDSGTGTDDTTSSHSRSRSPSFSSLLALALIAATCFTITTHVWAPFSLVLALASLIVIWKLPELQDPEDPDRVLLLPSPWYMISVWTVCIVLGFACDRIGRNIGEAWWYQLVWAHYWLLGCEGWRLHAFHFVVWEFLGRCWGRCRKVGDMSRVWWRRKRGGDGQVEEQAAQDIEMGDLPPPYERTCEVAQRGATW